ncbi:Lztr1 [Symbiodinium sp. CCMP2592]|nr:Lztr1 [Symbiodinium sp. CCMP2592]
MEMWCDGVPFNSDRSMTLETYPLISSMDFFVRQRQQNKLVSRLFSCPGFNTASCKMDFLHACDLGVTSDWLGSLLFYLQSEKIRGLSKLIRCARLYQDIKAHYDRTGVQDRLPKLLPTMLREEDRGKIKSPKLRAKEGEARALVGAAMELATKYLSPAKPAEQAMLHGTEALQSIYACLSTAAWDKEVFRVSSQRFLLLWGSLETYFEVDKLFRVKPKAHQLFELARGEVNPSKTWTYRDESYGHTLALLGRRRGGKFSMNAAVLILEAENQRRPHEAAVGLDSLEAKCVAAAFAVAKASVVWTDVTPSGTAPNGGRYRRSVVNSAGVLYFYVGGSAPKFWTIDLQAGSPTWSDITPSGDLPPTGLPRSAVITSDDVMWLFGAGTPNFNDLWKVDLKATIAFTEVFPPGELPAGRSGHTSVVTKDDVMWMFGGSGRNDLWKIDLKAATPTWSEESPSSSPGGRTHHVAVITSDDVMWIFGGSGNTNDLHKIDLKATPLAWNSVSPSGSRPSGRNSHAATISASDVMWLNGGHDGSTCVTSLWWIDTQAASPTWSELSPTGTLPTGRFAHQVHWTKGVLWLHAGSAQGCSGPTDFTDIWSLPVGPEETSTTTATASTTTSITGTATSTSTTGTSSISTTTTYSSTRTTSTTASITTTTSASTTESTSTTSTSASATSTSSSSSSSSTRTSSTTTASTSTTSTSSSVSSSSSRTTTTTSTTATTTMTTTTTTTTTTTATTTSTPTTTSSGTSTTATTSTTTSKSSSSSTTSSSRTSTTSTSSTSSSTGTRTESTSTSTSSSTSGSDTTRSSTATLSSTTSSVTSSTTQTWSSTTSTPGSAEELAELQRELLRQREAAEAIERVDATEEALVAEFAAALELNSSQGILDEASADVATGRLKMVAFSPAALDGNVTVIAVSSSEVEVSRVEVSPQVLAEAAAENGVSGPILLSITTVVDPVATKFQDRRVEGEVTSLVSSGVVSINFRTPDGTGLEVDRLTSPLRLVIQTDERNASCAYWSEDEKRWSFHGVTTLPGSVPGQITCLSSHLSLFGAVSQVIWDNAFLVLKCSTAWELFTAEGFQEALGQVSGTHWQSSLPAISVFTFLGLFCLVLSRAAYVDCRSWKLVPWEEIEPVLFKQTTEPSEEEAPKGWAWRRVAEVKEWTFWCAGICFGISDIAALILECKAPEASVNRCITSLHAHRSGVAKDSLEIIVQPDDRFELQEEPVSKQVTRSAARRSRFSRLVSNAVADSSMNGFTVALRDLGARWNVHIHGATAVRSILKSRWYARVCLLFPAFHPWLAVLRLSILTSYKVRVALIFLKLCTAGATNAVFFSSTSPAPGSDPSCLPTQNLLEQLVQNTVVGMMSALLGDCAIFTLFLVQNRKPVEKDWTEAAKSRQINVWRCRAALFWFLWLLYSTSCLLYVMMFLATSRLEDAHGWYLATGVSLLQDLVVLPLFMALCLGTMASLALLSSGIRARTEAKWLGGREVQREREPQPEEIPQSRRDSLHSDSFLESRIQCPPKQQQFSEILPGTPLEGG